MEGKLKPPAALTAVAQPTDIVATAGRDALAEHLTNAGSAIIAERRRYNNTFLPIYFSDEMDSLGKGYKSEWWSKKTRKKFFLWASYFIITLYILLLLVFILLSLFLPSIAGDSSHINFLKEFILYFSSPVILFAILLVLWSRETE